MKRIVHMHWWPLVFPSFVWRPCEHCFHTCLAESALCPSKTMQRFNCSHLVARVQVYPLAFKQGMMLAGKCEGFAHAVAISMPGCNTTQVQRPYGPHVQVWQWFSVS